MLRGGCVATREGTLPKSAACGNKGEKEKCKGKQSTNTHTHTQTQAHTPYRQLRRLHGATPSVTTRSRVTHDPRHSPTPRSQTVAVAQAAVAHCGRKTRWTVGGRAEEAVPSPRHVDTHKRSRTLCRTHSNTKPAVTHTTHCTRKLPQLRNQDIHADAISHRAACVFTTPTYSGAHCLPTVIITVASSSPRRMPGPPIFSLCSCPGHTKQASACKCFTSTSSTGRLIRHHFTRTKISLIATRRRSA